MSIVSGVRKTAIHHCIPNCVSGCGRITLSVAKTVQLLKGNSSKWIHETFPGMRSFEWQEGYGAFSIGVSAIDATKAYIRNQAEHHRRRTFREEFERILRKHGFDFDESMLD